jgi:hypothetical protein
MHDYGQDVLHQPLEKNADVIGILGEMTLLRYFQSIQGLRPDVQTIAADDPGQRLDAVADAMGQNRPVYLTRQLDGVPERYSLSSLGPLIRVQPLPVTRVPRISHPLDADFGPAKLLGYDLDVGRLTAIPDLWHAENERFLRVTLYWQSVEKMQTDAAVSIKVLRSDQRVFGQVDHRPVLGAYPTTDWRPGEIITDTYAVPLFLGTTPGDYMINATLYDANAGTVLGQRDLQKIALGADVQAPRGPSPRVTVGSDEYFAQSLAGYSIDSWNIEQTVNADLATFSLVGFSIDTGEHVAVRPGDALPLTLLWRAGSTRLSDDMLVRTWLEDSKGQTVASRDAPVSVGYTPSRWQADSYVRDWPLLRVPANVADGIYQAKLAVVSNQQLRGSALLPFSPTIVNLGRVEIKNRPRQMQPPSISNPVSAVLDDKIKMLGYDLTRDVPQRGVRLTVYWKSLALMDTSYTVFLHLLDGNNNVIVSADAVPGGGDLPTTGWIENEFITDTHAFTLPPDMLEGGYPIEIGLYDPATSARLKTADGQDHVVITSVNIP